MLGQRGKSNTTTTKDTTQRDKSKGTGERCKTKKIANRTKEYRQNKTFQNKERKFLQLIEGECVKTVQQSDVRKAKQF